MDPTEVVVILAGVTALLVAILSHIKYSSCWGATFMTRERRQTLERQASAGALDEVAIVIPARVSSV